MRCSILLLFSMLLVKSSNGMQHTTGTLQSPNLQKEISKLEQIAILQYDMLKILISTRENQINQINKLEKEVTHLKQSIDGITQAKEARHKKNKRRRARTK